MDGVACHIGNFSLVVMDEQQFVTRSNKCLESNFYAINLKMVYNKVRVGRIFTSVNETVVICPSSIKLKTFLLDVSILKAGPQL